MDLLSRAYGSDSDNDNGETQGEVNSKVGDSITPSSESCYSKSRSDSAKSGKWVNTSSSDSTHHHLSSQQNIVNAREERKKDIIGPISTQHAMGYISKRKRKAKDPPETTNTEPMLSSILAPYFTSSLLQPDGAKQAKYRTSIPRHTKNVFTDHTKPVLSLEWHRYDPRLLLSASLDGGVKLWDVEERGKCIATYNLHSGAVRDVEWVSGETAISVGYDCAAIHSDVAYGREITRLKHSVYVSVVKVRPSDTNVVLTGDFDGRLQLWDLRTSKLIKDYKGAGGKILDAAFLPSHDEFVASSDIVRKNAFSQAMNVWDLDSGVTLTHQLYFEPFSCPCLKVHNNGQEFLAQSNGNYVVLFSAKKPFKLNKWKRFQGHYVSGFDVGFDMNSDGSVLCSASSDGKINFYDYVSTKLVRTLTLTDSACLAVAWNPQSPFQVAVSDWKGKIYTL